MKIDDIKRNMWITFSKHKPQQISVGFSPESNQVIQATAPVSRWGLGMPYYVWSISLPYLAVSTVINGKVTYFSIDTRESDLCKLNSHYVISLLGKQDYKAILNYAKDKKPDLVKEEPTLSSSWLPSNSNMFLGIENSNSNPNNLNKENKINGQEDILDGLRDPSNPNTDWTVFIDPPADNLPPDNQGNNG